MWRPKGEVKHCACDNIATRKKDRSWICDRCFKMEAEQAHQRQVISKVPQSDHIDHAKAPLTYLDFYGGIHCKF